MENQRSSVVFSRSIAEIVLLCCSLSTRHVRDCQRLIEEQPSAPGNRGTRHEVRAETTKQEADSVRRLSQRRKAESTRGGGTKKDAEEDGKDYDRRRIKGMTAGHAVNSRREREAVREETRRETRGAKGTRDEVNDGATKAAEKGYTGSEQSCERNCSVGSERHRGMAPLQPGHVQSCKLVGSRYFLVTAKQEEAAVAWTSECIELLRPTGLSFITHEGKCSHRRA